MLTLGKILAALVIYPVVASAGGMVGFCLFVEVASKGWLG